MITLYSDVEPFLQKFLLPQAKRLCLTVDRIPVSHLRTGELDHQGAEIALRHDSLQLVAVRVQSANGTTVQEMMLVEQSPKLVAVIINRHGDEVLIRARAETGNVGVVLSEGDPQTSKDSHVLVGPPVQCSMGKLDAYPKQVPFSKFMADGHWEKHKELGGLFLGKVTSYGALRISTEETEAHLKELGDVAQEFTWITRRLAVCLWKRGLFTGQLATALGYLRLVVS